VAEIKIERKRHGLLPWIIGLLLLALVIWGLVETGTRQAPEASERGRAAREAVRDDIPPRLRQYAMATGGGGLPAVISADTAKAL
jgi:hypothetical protein